MLHLTVNDINRQHLRSAEHNYLIIPRLRTYIGSRNFRASGPLVWNSQPPTRRDLTIFIDTFKTRHRLSNYIIYKKIMCKLL